ncbi:MAG: lysophospholipid acyltransferase family protein [Acidimicrobiales bacterium]
MSETLEPVRRSGLAIYRGLQGVLRTLARGWFRFRVEGIENVPSTGGFVVAPGAHRSILDTPLTAMAIPRHMRFMGAEKYFAIPIFGSFLRIVGGFPVERSATDREALRIAEEILRGGDPLVIFPEATRYEGPVVQPLKEGAAFLASRAQVPILPISIGGAERSLGIGRYLPRPTKIHVIIGAPLGPPTSGDGGRVKRSAIKAKTDELQAVLQDLFDRAQASVDA